MAAGLISLQSPEVVEGSQRRLGGTGGIGHDGAALALRCHKPDHKEFSKVAVRTAIGFMVMEFVGGQA
ncbi:unnamed protein product [Musa acuminata var. zebrina]